MSQSDFIIGSVFLGVNLAVQREIAADYLAANAAPQLADQYLQDLTDSKATDCLNALKKCGYTQQDIDEAAAVIAITLSSTEDCVNKVSQPGFTLADITLDDTHDPALTAAIAELLVPETTASTTTPFTTTEEESTTMTTATSSIAIDATAASGLNAMLKLSTGGKIDDINKLIAERDQAIEVAALAKADAAKAIAAASRPVVPSTGTCASGIGELTYEVVKAKCCDIIIPSNGVKVSKMSFEIDTLVWKDSTGAIVQHPEVPNVDANYEFDMTQVVKFMTCVNSNQNAWLFGHTGTGKSTFVEQVAARTGFPVSRLNLDSNLERADLVGHTSLVQEAGATVTKFEEGIMPRAMQRPGYILMDEIDGGRPEILFVVQRALEHKGLLLTEDGGRLVTPHPLFRFVATANTRGQGDEYGMYSGTRVMNASMLDRFTAFLEFKYMAPNVESNLLTKRCPMLPKPQADAFANYAKEIRTAFEKAEVYNTISPRGLTAVADFYCTFTDMYKMKEDTALQLAIDMAIMSKVTNDTRLKFAEIAKRVFPKFGAAASTSAGPAPKGK